MRQAIVTILVVLGLALIVVGFSVEAFPQWVSLPGGLLLLLVAAFTGVAELGGKLKDWRDFMFGGEDTPKSETRSQSTNTPGASSPPSVDISGNKMLGKHKIGVYRDNVRIAKNPMVGESEIEVGEKAAPPPKRKRKKGKKRK